MEGRNFGGRYLAVLILVVILALVCIIRLFDLQVVKGEEYRQVAQQRLVQAYPVKAPRGEILDRYGKAFVQNRMGYVVQIQKIDISKDDLHDEILALSKLILENDGTLATQFPIFYDEENGFWGFTYTEGKESRKKIEDKEQEIREALRDGKEVDVQEADRMKEQ